MQKSFCDKCGKELGDYDKCKFSTDHYVDVEGDIRFVSSNIEQAEPSIFVEEKHYKSDSTFETEVCKDCFKKIWESFKK